MDSNGNPVISHLDVSDVNNGHLRLARLVVINRPLPPVAGDDAYTTHVNMPLLVDAPGVLANDSDPLNLAPIAQNDNYTTFQNTSLIILDPAQGFLANDTDPDGDTLGEAIKRSDPSHGTLGFVSIGTFSYKPEPGFVGVDSFTYQVPDKVADATPAMSNIATVTITVKAPNHP